MKGILQWYWYDTEGKLNRFEIPDSYYDPNGTRLLSPQHWVREVKTSKGFLGNDKCIQSDMQTTYMIRYDCKGVALVGMSARRLDSFNVIANGFVNRTQH